MHRSISHTSSAVAGSFRLYLCYATRRLRSSTACQQGEKSFQCGSSLSKVQRPTECEEMHERHMSERNEAFAYTQDMEMGRLWAQMQQAKSTTRNTTTQLKRVSRIQAEKEYVRSCGRVAADFQAFEPLAWQLSKCRSPRFKRL